MALPARIGRYELVRRLGAGGMGEVYLAHDPQLERRVAIKLLPSNLAADEIARERLRREALATAALDHPFVCKVFEVGEDAGTVFIAMEYVRGETLSARMRAGRLPFAEALRIAGEIAEALEEAHSVDIVHRDLKPANVILTTHGRVKVMDFGLAKRSSASEGTETLTVNDALTDEGTVVGTPDYLSPEQLKGAPLDGRSDLFSYGIILCELVLGRHPFQRHSSLETMAAILRDPPQLETSASAELSPGLMVLIRRLLAKSPDERYRSVRELRSDQNICARRTGLGAIRESWVPCRTSDTTWRETLSPHAEAQRYRTRAGAQPENELERVFGAALGDDSRRRLLHRGCPACS